MARDLAMMTSSLRRHLANGTMITRIVPLSTGHSNETYILEGLNRVLRMPPSAEGLLPPYDMARQHAVLDSLGRHPDGPPVPKVYELVTDSGVIGDPFFLMEFLQGECFEYQVPDWLADGPQELRAQMSRSWVTAIAALHCLPSHIMPPGAQTVAGEIRRWQQVAEQAEAIPALHTLIADLAADPPRESGSPTPLHGDPKQGNCLWSTTHRGELVGLLDWEMAGVGEPLIDMGYLLQWYDQGEASIVSAGLDLPGWWQRDRMLAEWERITGRTAHDMRAYETLGMCKVAAIIALGYHLQRTGKANDPRFDLWGTIVPRYVRLAQERAQLR